MESISDSRDDAVWKTVTLPADVKAALHERNYPTFAVLANVRNYRELPFISEARGLPDDFTDDADLGWHDLSWVTLQELLNLEWTQLATFSGVMEQSKFDFWETWRALSVSRPLSYRGVTGPGIVTLQDDEYRQRLTNGSLLKDVRIYVRTSWQERLSLAVGYLYSVVLPYLQSIGAPDDVRIVFGFDS